jgi:hypothetical protein
MADFRTARPDTEIDRATQSGHGPFTEADGSAGQTWICSVCFGRIDLTSGLWHGWALEYSCAEVQELHSVCP